MPLDFLAVGATPVVGYECLEDLGGTVFQRVWKVRAPNGATRVWKAIDLAVANAAVETRTLEMLLHVRHPRLNTLVQYHSLADHKALLIETEAPHSSLRQILKERLAQGRGGLTPEETVRWLAHAAEGIDHLNAPRHQFQGQQVAVYHRDLRPDVLLLFQENGETVCRVSDFGLAKPVTDQNAQHSQGLLHFDYDPPEFYEGVTAPNSDQYSLAIVHYELRTGKLPFHGTMLEQLQCRLEDRPDLSGVAGEGERTVLRRALSKDPKKRFGNCREFIAALAEAFAEGDAAAPVPAPPPSSGRLPSPFSRPPATFAGLSPQAAGGGTAVANRPTPLPGVTLRRPPQRVPTVTEITLESGEVDLTGILRGAKTPLHGSAPAPSRAASTRLREVVEDKRDSKIPMFWVFTIAALVFVGVAIVVKEFILAR